MNFSQLEIEVAIPSWCKKCSNTEFERVEERLPNGKIQVTLKCQDCQEVVQVWLENNAS